jgi:hypothetical protein
LPLSEKSSDGKKVEGKQRAEDEAEEKKSSAEEEGKFEQYSWKIVGGGKVLSHTHKRVHA